MTHSSRQGVPSTDPGGESSDHSAGSLDFLADVPLPITAEFGRTEVPVRKLLAWRPGTVLVCERAVDEPLEIRAHGRLIAKGEVVIVNDSYGIRITAVADPVE